MHKKFILPLIFLLVLGLFSIVPAYAQDSLETTLAGSAAKSFLTTLTRPELLDIRAFYLVPGVDPETVLTELGADVEIERFEIVQGTWLDDQTFETEALLKPNGRTLLLQTSRHENRWKVSGLTLVPLPVAEEPLTSTPLTATTPISGVQPIANGLSGQIVFQTHSGSGIYIVNADGTGLRWLTNGMDPELSPDGTQIVFTRWEPVYGLYTINVDGTNEQRLAAFEWLKLKSASWSPDSSRVVFSYQRGGQLEAKQEAYDFAEEALNDDGIHIPPNARGFRTEDGIFRFSVPADAHWHLQQVEVATGLYLDTATGNRYSYGSNWHPTDPSKIIFRGDKGLGLYDVNTMTSQSITTDDRDKAAVISPDGTKVAFTYWQEGHWDIHTVNIDGTARHRLTETPLAVQADTRLEHQEVIITPQGYRTLRSAQPTGQENPHWNNAAPAWSPDSQHLLFVTDRTGTWEIWIMNPDGSNQRPMFTNGALAEITLQYDGVDERMLSWR